MVALRRKMNACGPLPTVSWWKGVLRKIRWLACSGITRGTWSCTRLRSDGCTGSSTAERKRVASSLPGVAPYDNLAKFIVPSSTGTMRKRGRKRGRDKASDCWQLGLTSLRTLTLSPSPPGPGRGLCCWLSPPHKTHKDVFDVWCGRLGRGEGR